MSNKKQKLELAEIIRREADERGVTIKEMAKAAHIPYHTLQDWAHGKHPKSLSALVRLSKVLRISTDELLLDPYKGQTKLAKWRKD